MGEGVAVWPGFAPRDEREGVAVLDAVCEEVGAETFIFPGDPPSNIPSPMSEYSAIHNLSLSKQLI